MGKNSKFPKRRRNRKYDTEFKTNALRLVASGRSVASVASSLGIDKSLLYAWRRQAHPLSEEEEAELQEIDQLRKRVLELEQERDILKKALAIFSRKTSD
ncbi:MAG: transposase [Bacteroidota bacterium]